MNRKQQIAMLLILIIVFIAALGGCTEKNKITGAGESGTGNESLQDYTIQLYYANTAYMETGQEELPRLQEPFEVKIRSLPADVYEDTIDYLRHPPADEQYSTGLPEGIILNSVSVQDDGTAVVDFSSKDLNGGSMQEMFTIAQIVNSLLASFDEISRVQFTIDGAVAETLMGHYMITDPLDFQEL